MIPLNYHHLYYFYTVAKTGSIAKATDTLLLAQPTISAQIKELERFFKRPLFERRNRRLVLTEEGRCLLYTSPSPRDRTRSRMPSSA